MDLTKSLGLGWRSESFLRTCKILEERFGGVVPSDTNSLMSLPGVGHYVAAAVRSFGFGKRAILVDTNTIRIAARVAGKPADPANHRSQYIHDLVRCLGPSGLPPLPQDNYALLDLAALICLPRAPKCAECPISIECVTGRSVLDVDAQDDSHNQ